MKQLIDYIEQYVALDIKSRTSLQRLCRTEFVKKNVHVITSGSICKKLWFIKTGMVRKYYLHDGKEHTCWIHTENELFTSLQSYGQQIPATENIQACENSELISISRDNALILNAIPQFQLFSNKLMEEGMANIDKHTKEFAIRDAKGKYEYLRQIAPEIIKLGQIATIIGITPETLSRIRKS